MLSQRGSLLAQVSSSRRRFLTRSCTNSTSKTPPTKTSPLKAYIEEQERNRWWYKIRPDKSVKPFDEIPGPKFLPLIGHEWRYNKYIGIYNRDYIHHTFKKLLDQYGYVVREHIGRNRVIVHLFHHEDIGIVYKNDGMYPSRMSNRIMEHYRNWRPDEYDSPGLGPSNGTAWRKFRSQFNRAPKALVCNEQKEDLNKLANDLMTKVTSELDKNGEADIMRNFYRWTLEGVGLVTLSRRLGCLDPIPNPEADKLIEAAETTNSCIYITETSPHQWETQYQRLVPAQDYFSGVVKRYIADALERKTSFMTTIMNPDTNLKDLNTFVLDLFQAGIHTTAITAVFALYHLARNPSVQDELRSKIKEKLPTKSAPYMGFDQNEIKYLGHVISETLRMNPPTIGNGRILSDDLVLGGYEVPAGTMTLLHHMTASRLEENFRSPKIFKPERFASDNSPYYDKEWRKTTLYASRPFGSGGRGCLGQILAQAQMRLAIVKFVRNFKLSYHHEDIDTVNRLHNEPDRPVKLRFEPIND